MGRGTFLGPMELRTTPSRATKYTPFFMVYGSEAVLPIDLEYVSPRLKAYNKRTNKETRENMVDQLEEARDMGPQLSKISTEASMLPRQARTQEGPERGRPRLTPMAKQSRTPQGNSTLGPYVVAKVLKPRTYKLADEKGAALSRVSVRGILTVTHDGITRTQVEALNSTLWPGICTVLDNRSPEDGKGVERIDQGSSAATVEYGSRLEQTKRRRAQGRRLTHAREQGHLMRLSHSHLTRQSWEA